MTERRDNIKTPEELIKLHSKEYVSKYEKKPINRISRLLNTIEFKDTQKVADFACGNGMLMELIAPKVSLYEGIDFSEDFIQSAEKRLKKSKINNAVFYCADINEFLKEREESYDLAFTLDFSEHVYDAEWVKLLQSIHKGLKKGGKLYLHTPNADFFVELMKKNNILLKQFPEHIAVRTIGENINLLEKAGFTAITCIVLPHYNILKYIHLFSFLPFIGKYFKARLFIEAIK